MFPTNSPEFFLSSLDCTIKIIESSDNPVDVLLFSHFSVFWISSTLRNIIIQKDKLRRIIVLPPDLVYENLVPSMSSFNNAEKIPASDFSLIQNSGISKLSTLTRQEINILYFSLSGLSVKSIANLLGKNLKTVYLYRAKAFKKTAKYFFLSKRWGQ